MYFVYLLKRGNTKEIYYGYTNDLNRRLGEHSKVDNKWKLIYYEAYLSEVDAKNREKKLKDYGQSRNHLKGRIKHSLEF
jgi:putative endonuclease